MTAEISYAVKIKTTFIGIILVVGRIRPTNFIPEDYLHLEACSTSKIKKLIRTVLSRGKSKMPDLTNADILIVTVTPVESRAVLKAFESFTGQKATPNSLADRTYRDLGIINGSKIFMALSEMGAGGLGAAQQTVQKAIAALHPHAVIMWVSLGLFGRR